MNILKRTPRTVLSQRVIGTKALGIVPSLAKEMGFENKDIDHELMLFAVLSTRIVFNEDEIDFSVLSASDTEAQIAQKFVAYLDSERYDSINSAWELLNETDKPTDVALAPSLPDEKETDPKKSRS